jgi:hypothetical protein
MKKTEREREIIKLTPTQHQDICLENYYEVNGKEIPIKILEEGYDGSGRHTEEHFVIFKRLSDKKCFRVDYETSVKDEMGWMECNWQKEFDALEVFPTEKKVTIYE